MNNLEKLPQLKTAERILKRHPEFRCGTHLFVQPAGNRAHVGIIKENILYFAADLKLPSVDSPPWHARNIEFATLKPTWNYSSDDIETTALFIKFRLLTLEADPENVILLGKYAKNQDAHEIFGELFNAQTSCICSEEMDLFENREPVDPLLRALPEALDSLRSAGLE